MRLTGNRCRWRVHADDMAVAPTVEMRLTGTVSYDNGFGSPAIGQSAIRTTPARLSMPVSDSVQ